MFLSWLASIHTGYRNAEFKLTRTVQNLGRCWQTAREADFTKLSQVAERYGCRLDDTMKTRTIVTALAALTVATAWSATNAELKLQPVTLAVTGMT